MENVISETNKSRRAERYDSARRQQRTEGIAVRVDSVADLRDDLLQASRRFAAEVDLHSAGVGKRNAQIDVAGLGDRAEGPWVSRGRCDRRPG